MSEEMNAVQTEQTENAQVETTQTPQIDYDKIASIVDGKLKVTEESVLKGYFKQQGLTGDEMSQAIEMFKQDKASREPNVEELNQTIADRDAELLEATSRALYAETQMEAMNMAYELGVDQKTIPYLMKMADLSSVIVDGQIDHDTLKESLSEVLKDIPQLKVEPETSTNSFKVGADTSDQKQNNSEELAKIFGVSKK